MAKVTQFIETSRRVGEGTDSDPSRLVYELWTLDGKLVAEYDGFLEKSYYNSILPYVIEDE